MNRRDTDTSDSTVRSRLGSCYGDACPAASFDLAPGWDGSPVGSGTDEFPEPHLSDTLLHLLEARAQLDEQTVTRSQRCFQLRSPRSSRPQLSALACRVVDPFTSQLQAEQLRMANMNRSVLVVLIAVLAVCAGVAALGWWTLTPRDTTKPSCTVRPAVNGRPPYRCTKNGSTSTTSVVMGQNTVLPSPPATPGTTAP